MILKKIVAFFLNHYNGSNVAEVYLAVERITHVAIMYDGVMYTKEKPHRHHHIIEDMVTKHRLPKGLAGNVQGFMTDRGRFVDRTEGALIAVRAGQLIGPIRNGKLFSEELW